MLYRFRGKVGDVFVATASPPGGAWEGRGWGGMGEEEEVGVKAASRHVLLSLMSTRVCVCTRAHVCVCVLR